MSRKQRNRRLADLCRHNDLRLGDLAAALEVDRWSLSDYATGRRPMARLESRLAGLCAMSVQDLRRYLFPPATPQSRRQHAAAAPEPGRIPRIVTLLPVQVIWIYRPGQPEKWVGRNSRAAFGNLHTFRDLRANGLLQAAGAHITARPLTPTVVGLQLHATPGARPC